MVVEDVDEEDALIPLSMTTLVIQSRQGQPSSHSDSSDIEALHDLRPDISQERRDTPRGI